MKSMNNGRLGRYTTYALGEILLVVVGILLALQINTWNENRVEQNTIRAYFERIHEELKGEAFRLDRFISNTQRIEAKNRRTLQLLNDGSPDSLAMLKETLGALGTAWTHGFSLPVTDEFLSQDYLTKVRNDSIKYGFQAFKYGMDNLRRRNEMIDQHYVQIIEPFINGRFNYSEVALDRYQGHLVQGGPPTDFAALKDDMQMWNVTSLKLESISLYIEACERVRDDFLWLDRQIVKELEVMGMVIPTKKTPE